MKTLLMYPPVTDPTSAYHSLTYLETYAREHGHTEIDIVDTNIEAFHYSMRPEEVQRVLTHMQQRRSTLEAQAELNGLEQIELFTIVQASSFDFSRLSAAVDLLRDPEAFYQYDRYKHAVELVVNWLESLSIMGFPGQFAQFGTNLRGPLNPQTSEDLVNHELTERMLLPFEPYFQNVLLPRIAAGGYATVGINVTYTNQLPFALGISRLIRNAFPEITILFGGTEVSDVWKYMTKRERFFEIFDAADACVVGEGEIAFVRLLDMIENKQFTKHANVFFHPRHEVKDDLPVIQYLDIAALPTPNFDKINWDLYLSPEPFIYYSPSRGCYWNKCTFCDYGLNGDSPTSPWRHNPLEKVVEDLRVLSKSYKFIYFSVDVLAPSMLLHLSERLIEEGIDIRWGAEIRLEKYWSPERAKLLKDAGCVAVSVGFESGNQRILNLINKGTQIQSVEEVIKNFSEAGIAVQIMGFTGFPGETMEEAKESIDFLMETRSQWTFGGLGRFMLTQGAIVAKQPEEFGVTEVGAYQNEDVPRSLHYLHPEKRTKEEEDALDLLKSKMMTYDLDRPWVGGVDASHSFFYHDRFGTHVLKQITKKPEATATQEFVLNGNVVEEPVGYPLNNIHSPRSYATVRISQKETHKAGMVAREIFPLLESLVIAKDETANVEKRLIRNDGSHFKYSNEILDFFAFFKEGNTLQNYLDLHPEADASLFKRLLHVALERKFLKPALTEELVSTPLHRASL
ncbi:B12-binding domain-containing radical SAM protein [Tumebacillus sp. ITR2]|uniref:B12-binding domain-containing radical SAM protein n=1 Tax=Tumebacillus amylolyticus TaxID=2801339 RepID=A0ABS1J4E8_9BACL|nr:radical SAM protein [Tumebacillus amylolyticus]MBL0385146.1 B12-binding domain-containing radical SAM protein [Tumebacillus amylolyticus]